jgi:hypothetical protein
MKLNHGSLLPYEYNRASLDHIIRAIETSLNNVAEGNQIGFYNAQTAAPTTGQHAKGDFVLNSNPSEAGGVGVKYIIHGWRCAVAGTPGTWLECRFLTGN